MNSMPLPKALAWLGRLMLSGLSLLSVAIVFFLAAGRLQGVPKLEASLMLVAPAVGALAWAYVALRKPDRTVTRIAWELVALAISLLAVESMIAIWAPEIPSPQLTRARTAEKLGLPFDLRTKSEVVAELRTTGVDAYPSISREWPQMAAVRQQLPAGLFPVSHASRVTVVECNETGEYLEYQTDEFGFRNPSGLLASRAIDVAAVGASFALGHCLPVERTVVGIIRATFPRTASLAMAGGGSLSNLATFREYVEPLRPPVVLWVMHPNTANIADELSDPTLPRYFEPEFSQHLIDRQTEIDKVWRELAIPVQYEFDRRSKTNIAYAEEIRFKRIPFLPQLRWRVHVTRGVTSGPSSIDLEPFLHTLNLARSATESWGGQFVVAIMPLYQDVVAGQLPQVLRHEQLAALLNEKGFEVLDTGALFAAQPDPAGLYTMRINNHPNAGGYALLGNYIVAELERRFPERMAGLQR